MTEQRNTRTMTKTDTHTLFTKTDKEKTGKCGNFPTTTTNNKNNNINNNNNNNNTNNTTNTNNNTTTTNSNNYTNTYPTYWNICPILPFMIGQILINSQSLEDVQAEWEASSGQKSLVPINPRDQIGAFRDRNCEICQKR